MAALLAFCVTGCGAPTEPSPEEVEIGTAYSYEMYTHCGALEAKFAGEYWEVDPTNSRQTNSSTSWDDPYQEGTMTRLSETAAVFEAEGTQKHYRLRPEAAEFLQICS